ncbi:MAG: HPr family phosphocarrier protein [Blastocatellia bacterium]|nr:HPr family phosphocarrier protein [Blastocatellia bacterium]MCS7156246.1 HPr family phosphocarrier protein [Blastocatellia bacterium]MCX7751404.1 HPr family phosphocarrier protein [Blastocatellia bacterium]MDW8169117.1 HPr family phosphocarrier protein [Acidobacteriota bacterium]MDW8255821.1 HPr family phosphocarrier protein [Acidobacteriota bacterium]
MQRRTVQVTNRLGLHARAAAKLVHVANRFQSTIALARCDNGQTVDAKSILGVLLLAASAGTYLDVIASGDDEEEAVEAICRLIESKFGEEGGATS